MKITDLPFNKFIDLQLSENPYYLLMLQDDIKYTNHLETVHASALFSLAEATSGHFLLTNFPEYETGLIPVVRKVETKYKKPAQGKMYSTAILIDDNIENIKIQLANKNRALVKLRVNLFDSQDINVLTADFEWFVTIQLTQ
jgi:hypothetical protein